MPAGALFTCPLEQNLGGRSAKKLIACPALISAIASCGLDFGLRTTARFSRTCTPHMSKDVDMLAAVQSPF